MLGLSKLITLGTKVLPYAMPLVEKVLPKPKTEPLPSAQIMGEPEVSPEPEPVAVTPGKPSAWKQVLAWSVTIVLVYSFIGRPTLEYLIALSGVIFGFDVSDLPPLPSVEASDLLRMLASLIGLGV